MPHVEFTPNLARQTRTASFDVPGGAVAEALQAVFTELPAMRGHIMDDQGAVRQHVVIFLDGTSLKDRRHLSDPVRPDSGIFVMQALSGG
jgi:hypothetical protein